MPYITTIPPRLATGETALVYRELSRVLGTDGLAARIVQAFSLRPGSMLRMVRSWELSMWVGAPPRRDRELLASIVSRLNDCHY